MREGRTMVARWVVRFYLAAAAAAAAAAAEVVKALGRDGE